ncbi:FAD-binding oxidoreductase [bacterium SCSIO 12643]|nr:FAD-binding oxidoreductase [bacterium SCSIO 12643]
MKTSVDFLIVGQGLAGTVLSQKLFSKGFKINVIENFVSNSASRIAAGVFNPVTYRKLKMAEFADFLIPEVFEYYVKVEKELGQKFFYPTSFLKLITDFEELNNWQIQSEISTNKPFMSQEIVTENFGNKILNPFGAGQVLQSGLVKVGQFLDAWKAELRNNGLIHEEKFCHDDLKQVEGGYQYGEIFAQNIIFCEGVGVVRNPWFNWLPMQQFKGEVIEIYAPELEIDRLLNRGVFVLPLGEGKFKIGATHDWKHVDENITEEGKKELTDKLDKILNVDYQIISHHAGLRPATRDRRPFIGAHPEMKNMFVLNGLGSKGVIMIPWLADVFIKGLKDKEWPKTFNIERYIRFYNTKVEK